MRRFLKLLTAVALVLGVNACEVAYATPNVPTPTPATERAMNAAVEVIRPDGGHGSGVVIRPGMILTAQHVVDGVDGVIIVTRDGTRGVAVVLWEDKTADVALVVTSPKIAHDSAHLACGSPVSVGEKIFTVGYPGAFPMIATFGRVAGFVQGLVVADMHVWFGNSGGGVFDADGNVVGLADAIHVPVVPGTMGDHVTSGLSFFVPATVACKLIEAHSK